ncbi:MAG: Gfo/Idh/MocA family oxidoreductase [Dysgonamonadaceae bacterium]|jgi:predicted dehydrogenase|nr:Gfo/Idh/MocA family oxidoreductase [Dysgonamonadaceae bacterium]
MNNDRKISFATVGCGHIGKRHIEMISRNPDSQLIAVCDVLPPDKLNFSPDIMSKIAEGKIFFTSSLESLLANASFDVLNICTPNGMHAQMAVEGLKTGHNVVIEKPVALNTSDAKKILETAEKHNRKVFCVMQNRYSPPSVWIKELVESGKLGKIFIVQVNCYWNRDERYYIADSWHGDIMLDGGTLFTQFSHFIDLMFWLFGDIKNIRSRFADFNHANLTDFDDSGIVTFDFIRGGIGVLNFSTSVYSLNFESSVTIIAENGTVKIGGQYMNEVEYCNVKDYEMSTLPPTNPGNDYGAYKGSAQNHHLVIENVVNVLKNDNIAITANAYDGYKVIDIIERMMNS